MTVMKGANQALSYIVFVRDRARFETTYRGLEIVHQEPLKNYLRYLVSGGLNFRSLLPDASIPALRFLEACLVPMNRILALHHVVVLRKKA